MMFKEGLGGKIGKERQGDCGGRSFLVSFGCIP